MAEMFVLMVSKMTEICIGMPAVMPCFYRYSLFKEGNDIFLIVLLTIATMYCSLCYQRNVIYSITWGREFMMMMTTGVDKGGAQAPPPMAGQIEGLLEPVVLNWCFRVRSNAMFTSERRY